MSKRNELIRELAEKPNGRIVQTSKQSSRKKRVINISLEVFNHIDKHVESMTDTPDKILRRLLGLPQKE